jgi:hypothetical protein
VKPHASPLQEKEIAMKVKTNVRAGLTNTWPADHGWGKAAF